MRAIRVGSRESKLAVVQTQIVIDAVQEKHPELEFEIITMKTTGDRILDRTVDQIGGKGLFVKELDEALLSGRVDLTVHSYKDMPTEENPNLPIVAVSRREDARDVLLLPRGMEEVRGSVGCSSQRRRLQLQHLHPQWEIRPVRGNVLTRIEKMERGEYGALVLAAAGIKRLDLWKRVNRVFSPEEILPCPCQGTLAVQAKQGSEVVQYLQDIHDRDAWDASVAERSYLFTLGGGCSSPAAAYAQVEGESLFLQGLHVSEEGQLCRGSIHGLRGDGKMLGEQLALRLMRQAKRGVAVG